MPSWCRTTPRLGRLIPVAAVATQGQSSQLQETTKQALHEAERSFAGILAMYPNAGPSGLARQTGQLVPVGPPFKQVARLPAQAATCSSAETRSSNHGREPRVPLLEGTTGLLSHVLRATGA